MATQTKYWVFTTNNPQEQHVFDSDSVQFAVWQLERGEQGTLHFQGYVEFKASKRRAGCSKALGGRSYVAPRRGSQADCIAYCTKEGGRVAGPWRFGEPTLASGLVEFVARLRDGTALRTAALEDVDTYSRHRSALQQIASWVEPRRWRDVSCFYLVGETGTGKSALVYDTFGYDNVYTLASQAPLWFDRYAGQRVLFIDEFEGAIGREALLRILDGHPYDGPVKGGFVGAQWTVVVICANVDFYTGFCAALKRRFDRGGFFRVVGRRGDPGHDRVAELFRGALRRGGGVPVLEAGAAAGAPGVDQPVVQPERVQPLGLGVVNGAVNWNGEQWIAPNN